MREIAKLQFKAELVLESSYSVADIGEHDNTMTLWASDTPGVYQIEWVYEDARGDEDVEHIGIWVDKDNELVDYDGVFSLPKEALQLLKNAGISTSEHERDLNDTPDPIPTTHQVY